MKKIILSISAFLVIASVSCRQSDDILTNEDVTTIKMIESNREDGPTNSDTKKIGDSATNSNNEIIYIDGEIVQPPRR